jgi:hypothetical protein
MLTTTYRLASADFVNAPGLIAWAINGYAFEKDRRVLRDIVSKTWGIPDEATDALLLKRVPFTVENGTVIFEYGAPVTVPAALFDTTLKALEEAEAISNVAGASEIFSNTLRDLRALLPKSPTPPRHRGIFSDFDYNYIVMIEQLPGWLDSTWRNDTSPSAEPEEQDGFRLWFDYASPSLSEHVESRLEGTMKRFTLTLDWPDENAGIDPGTTVFSSDDWGSMKAFILDGRFEAYRAAIPKPLASNDAKVADKIDGFDRDDTGESPDY